AVPTVEVLDVMPVVEAVTGVKKPKPKRSGPKPQPIAIAKPRRKSRVLLGCFLLTLAAIISFTFLSYYFIRTVIDKADTWIHNQANQMKVEATAWDHLEKTFAPPVANLEFPPTSPEADRLFPLHIQNFDRQSIDKNTKLPALDFDADGYHAAYRATN